MNVSYNLDLSMLYKYFTIYEYNWLEMKLFSSCQIVLMSNCSPHVKLNDKQQCNNIVSITTYL